ncbi:transcription factor LBX1-like [Crassostrea virginica]|uniref:Transcription factor LBX1-like n=1 Tax=Crassostrea virginica TaxID=6565 RepID=A0A8B8E4A6_CRAVI|nr:transcription factor LBX1-like [Crassostrea virginica]
MRNMSAHPRVDSAESIRDQYEALRKLAMVQVGPPRNPNKPFTSFSISDILGGNNNQALPNRRQAQRNLNNNNNHVRSIVRPWDPRNSPGRDSECSSDEEEINVEDDEPSLPLIQNDSPLDALMKMANKTFEGLETAETAEAKRREQAALFGKHQPPKKRRKSRTAFTNQQIYELEKRFLYQKYLTPADRDEIAQNLGLSNAQVITWFQNRRAKLKRDLEELKNDVTATQILKTSSEKDDDESERSFSTDPEVSRSADEDDCEPSPAKVQRTSESEAENASEKDDSSDVDMEIHSP